ncbi:MAG: hypothetical protein LHV68_07250 [Elusimicrobia bacterium]|nr:hypothetical protein [Candidatus Liberimonas magnetica]
MQNFSVLKYIKDLKRPVFTTSEISKLSGKSLSSVTQALNYLVRQRAITKIYRGIWSEITEKPVSTYLVIPFLFHTQRAYVSFTTALHLYGMIEQIPQVITLASTTHSKIIRTGIGTFSVHQLAPYFFDGFEWYKGTGGFLIATPEKALVDCLYIATRKKNQFQYFPELNFPKSFNFKIAEKWADKIQDGKIKSLVLERLKQLKKQNG